MVLALDFGIFNDLVKVTGLIMTSALAISLSWKGRANWEPSEEDIPNGPQKIGGLFTAIAIVFIWLTTDDTQGNAFLKVLAVVLAVITIVSLLVYGYLISVHTYLGKNEKKIIGGYKLTSSAALLKSQDQTVQEILKNATYNTDKVWTRSSRAIIKSLFTIFYIALTCCGTAALTSCAVLVINKSAHSSKRAEPVVKNKKSVQIAIILSGDIYYTRQISEGFTTTLDSLLLPSPYIANYESTTINPDTSFSKSYDSAIQAVLAKFPGSTPDYIVPIGTQAAEYVNKHFLNKLPIIFIGVTDPKRSKLVKSYEKDASRGNIAGVIYSLPPKEYLDFFHRAFPGKRFGFLYNKNFPQDKYFLELMQQASKQLTPKVEIVPIEVTTPTLSSDQVQKADIFFGRYYVASNIGRFIASCSKPFVAGDISNITKGAVACISPDSRKLGKIAAAEYLYPNLLQGRALNDMIIKGEKEPVTAINLSVARKYGITINDQVIQEANKIIQ